MGSLSGWNQNNRIAIIVDGSKIDESLTNFPVRLHLGQTCGVNQTDLRRVFTELGANSKKIAVTTFDGTTQCYIEIERWDNTGQVAELWVKIPSVSPTINTVLYLYYDNTQVDNSSYVGDIGSTPGQSVWDSAFKAVYHMSQDPSGPAPQIKDSTVNANNGTSYGAMTSGDLVNAKIGKGIDHDGSDDRINVPDSASLDMAAALTVEGIIKFNQDYSGAVWKVPISKGATSGNWRLWQLEIHTGGTQEKVWKALVRKTSSDAGVAAGSAFAWATGVDYNFAFTYDKQNLKVLKDGTVFGTTAWTEDLVVSNQPLNLGSGWYAGNPEDYTNCVLDEIRLSNVARSAAWLKATHYSNFDNLLSFAFLAKIAMDQQWVLDVFLLKSSGLNQQWALDVFFLKSLELNQQWTLDVALLKSLELNQQWILDVALLKSLELNQQWILNVPVLESSGLDQQWALEIPVLNSSGLTQQWSLLIPALFLQSLQQLWDLLAGPIPSVVLKQVRYICTLDDLGLPIEGFNGRFKDGDPSYLSVRVPDGKRFADEIALRSTGELVIIREGVMLDNSIKSDEIARVNLETIRQDRGARNSTVTLVGHKQTTNAAPKRVDLEGVSYRGEYGGKRHIRCMFSQDIRPGDTAVFGVEEIVVGDISYTVGASITTMEIAEA